MYFLGFTYIGFLFIAPFVKRKFLNLYFIFISTILAITAFYIKPDFQMDLYRHYDIIDNMRLVGSEMIFEDPLFLKSIYFYLISLTPYNGLLPAITIFLIYFINFKLIHKIGIKYNCSTIHILLGAFLFIFGCNFLATVSGIRSGLAYTFFVYFLYRELVEHKSKIFSWTIYFLMCFLHTTMIIFIFFRMFLEVKDKFINISLKFILLVWILFIDIITNFLLSFDNTGIFSLLIAQIELYFQWEQNSMLSNFYYSSVLIFAIFFTSQFYKNYINSFSKIGGFFRVFIFSIFLIIGSIEISQLYIRFISQLLIYNSVLIMLLFHCISKNRTYGSNSLMFISYSIYVLFIIWNIFYLFQQHYGYIRFY